MIAVLGHICTFIVICAIFTLVLNLQKIVRFSKDMIVYQIFYPLIAMLYCIVILYFIELLMNILLLLLGFICNYLPFLSVILNQANLVFLIIFNCLIVVGFILLKILLKPLISYFLNKYPFVLTNLAGLFYEYDETDDIWLLKDKYIIVRDIFKWMFVSGKVASVICFMYLYYTSNSAFRQLSFYPVIGLLIFIELVSLFDGYSKDEYLMTIEGEGENNIRLRNYNGLRLVLKKIFPDYVIDDNMEMSNIESIDDSYRYIETLLGSTDHDNKLIGQYFNHLLQDGKAIDSQYIKSVIDIINNKNVIFLTPFYRDLSDYLFFVIIRALLHDEKVLFVLGRNASENEIKNWILETNNDVFKIDGLWKIDCLDEQKQELDIGILKASELFDHSMYLANESYFKKVKHVVLMEPSLILATSQRSLQLLVQYLNPTTQFTIFDKNSDGLVDILSHVLKSNIVEVSATKNNALVNMYAIFDGDKKGMMAKMIPGITRYLGTGSEIATMAIKYGLDQVYWLAASFPVLDMKWIFGQYYKSVCDFSSLPGKQHRINDYLSFDSNIWSSKVTKEAFIIVEDEYSNLYEMIRQYSTRGQYQSFVGVITSNYLLRDYMVDNALMLITDPKAIPEFAPIYDNTLRNKLLELMIAMTIRPFSEKEISDILAIPVNEDFISNLLQLVNEHLAIDEKELDISVDNQKKLMINDLSVVKDFQSVKFICEDLNNSEAIERYAYNQIYQKLLPKQFITLEGKYYEISSIDYDGVLLQRAADRINNRRYYRQLRTYKLKDNNSNLESYLLNNMIITNSYMNIEVITKGFLELEKYNDIASSKEVVINQPPNRYYQNKRVLKIQLPEVTDNIRITITILLNELFKTTYPNNHSYLIATTKLDDEQVNTLKGIIYPVDVNETDKYIYIIEDSQFDIGLISSVEKNLERFITIILDYLNWHLNKISDGNEDYKNNYYLLFGFKQQIPLIDLKETYDYLYNLGFNDDLLKQIRTTIKTKDDAESNIDDPNVNYCDFCGRPLDQVDYDVLPDGRERCPECSRTAVKTLKELKLLYNLTVRNMEIYFGIKIHKGIKIKMVNAKELNKIAHIKFTPTSGFDARALGIAIKKRKHEYVIYVENSSPRTAFIATLVHELTHIWQYKNWNEKEMRQQYGRKHLEIDEGMAKWVEIQYMILIGEKGFAKRQELLTLKRNDEYGKGLKLFIDKYPFSLGSFIETQTPFNNIKTPL